jgi:hypothetical protein
MRCLYRGFSGSSVGPSGCGTLVADTEKIDDNKGRIVWRCLNGEALWQGYKDSLCRAD